MNEANAANDFGRKVSVGRVAKLARAEAGGPVDRIRVAHLSTIFFYSIYLFIVYLRRFLITQFIVKSADGMLGIRTRAARW